MKAFYYKKFDAANSNIKDTWKTLNYPLNKHYFSYFQSYFVDNNETITDPSKFSNGFSDYFVNIGHKYASNIHWHFF